MELSASQGKILKWVEAQQPLIGMFHVMTELAPMIASGLIEQHPVQPSKRQLVITERGRAALERLTAH